MATITPVGEELVSLGLPFIGVIDKDARSYGKVSENESTVELESLVNFDVGSLGQLKVRPGLNLVKSQNVGAASLNYIGAVFGSGGVTALVFSDSLGSTSLHLFNAATNYAYTTFVIGATDIGSFVQYKGKLYFTFNTIFMKEVDLAFTTATAIAGSPQGSIATLHQDRIWVTAVNALTQRIYFSLPGDPTATGWSAPNFIDVSPGDGGMILNIFSFRDMLVIFKTNGIWTLLTNGSPAQWILRKVSDEYITPNYIQSHKSSVIVKDNFYYFLNVRKFLVRSDGVNFQVLSKSLSGIISDESAFDPGSPGVLYLWGNKLLIPSGSSGQGVRVYDLDTDIWSTFNFPTVGAIPTLTRFWTPYGIVQLNINNYGPNLMPLYFDKSGNNFLIYEIKDSQLSDNGVAIVCTFKTKEFYFKDEYSLKRLKNLLIELYSNGGTSTIDIDYVLDQGSRTINNGALTIASGKGFQHYPGPGMFRSIALQATLTAAVGEKPEIYQIKGRLTRHRKLV